ncbi:hypothetical protein FHX08_003428 [Rhizobium sp. BK529]|uniref:hypothetical protein n=1 Tax=unclassified Rhizobium TaxID=2613769 RepID=UPI001404EBD1|nr:MULTISPECIES: hypothetical protein [unclassified Rhizobium]MBB3593084.1 hypothetical protein [Rhizobium sp. BK529]
MELTVGDRLFSDLCLATKLVASYVERWATPGERVFVDKYRLAASPPPRLAPP